MTKLRTSFLLPQASQARTLAALALATLALTACGSQKAPATDPSTSSSASVSSSASPSVSASADASAEASAAETTDALAEGAAETETAAPAEPSSEAPAQEEASPVETQPVTGETNPGHLPQEEGSAQAAPEAGELTDEEKALDGGFNLDSIPADMTISAERAATLRPEALDSYLLEGNSQLEGHASTLYRSAQEGNESTLNVAYLPAAQYGQIPAGFEEGAQLGAGTCSLRLDSETSRTVRCEYPVVEGGVLLMLGELEAQDPEQLDLYTDFFIQSSAYLAFQMKN